MACGTTPTKAPTTQASTTTTQDPKIGEMQRKLNELASYVRTVPPPLLCNDLRKCQLLHPAPPYYPLPQRKFHTRGNVGGFPVG